MTRHSPRCQLPSSRPSSEAQQTSPPMLGLYYSQTARADVQHWFVSIPEEGRVFQLGSQQVSFFGEILLSFSNSNRLLGVLNRVVQWQRSGVIVEIMGMASGAPNLGSILVWVHVPCTSLYRARQLFLHWFMTRSKPIPSDHFTLTALGTCSEPLLRDVVWADF